MRTFGNVVYDQKHAGWTIKCEPQVSMRLKRVFGSVGNYARSEFHLSNTIEIARDLLWFLNRYPMIISPEDLSLLQSKHDEHLRLVEDIGSILSPRYKPSKTRKLAIPLRKYQNVAVDLVKKVYGTILGDDVGLGKTAEAIGVIADPKTRPVLVVTLTHLPKQWREEINRFLPGLRIHILKKGRPYQMQKDGNLPDIIISNYHKLNGWAEELSGKVKTVVFDECQELRRCQSNKYRAAQMISVPATYKFGLSATPIYNYGGEIYNVLDILRPDALGTWTEFSTEWCSEYTVRDFKPEVKDARALGSYLREAGLMLRRTRAEVKRELPALTVVPHTIDSDIRELDKIKGTAAALAKIILEQGGKGLEKMQAAEEFSWKLRQATGIAKAPFVADFVRMLIENGESVLLYGYHHEVYSLWFERLKDLDPAFFTGKESVPQKEASKQAFLKGKTKLLIMSLRAGQGVDGLQNVCRTVVHGELDWSPAIHIQATGRIYRDGQPDPVVSYFLVSDDGSDPFISDILDLKRKQIDGVINPVAELLSRSQTDPDRIRSLARDYLDRQGTKKAEAHE